MNPPPADTLTRRDAAAGPSEPGTGVPGAGPAAARPVTAVDEDQGGAPLEAWRRHPAVVEGLHVVRVRADELARRRDRQRSPREWAGVFLVWGLLAVALMAVGMVVAMSRGALPGDALARVQAARGMVAGRDPHPEAIGFVWGPFPTVFEAPFAWLARWWPSVTGTGAAAVAVSAMALSATALQLFGWGHDLGARRWVCTVVVALTLAHPLVWTAGVNGMSEACWFLFLVVAGRRLTRWFDTDDPISLAVAGVALGLAYLTRFESLAAILAVTGLVALCSFQRSHLDWLVPPEYRLTLNGFEPIVERPRLRAAAVDAVLVAFPALAAVGAWALACWAIIGEPLPQLTSEHGNAALVAAGASGIAQIVGDPSPVGRAWFFLRQLLAASAAAGLVAVVAVWASGRTAWRAAVAVCVLGAPLAVQGLLSMKGSTFPWFRYVSSGVLLAGVLVLVVAGDRALVRWQRWVVPTLCVALVPGIIVSTSVVRSGDLGAFDEARVSQALVDAWQGRPSDASASISRRGQEVADAIDRMPRAVAGSVLTDTSSTFAVVSAARRPDVYIVPADRDFEPIVADPPQFGVRYLLLRGPAAAGDALRGSYPGIWDGIRGLAVPVATWGEPGEEGGHYRLLKVVDPDGPPPARPSGELGPGS